jgi:hypothetical protein
MVGIQCNVNFGYQDSVWSGTEQNQGKQSLRLLCCSKNLVSSFKDRRLNIV